MTPMRSFIIAGLLAILAIGAAATYILTSSGPDPVVEDPVENLTEAETPDEIETEVAVSIAPPSFDIVRIDLPGTAVIAGRGEPGALIEVLANGERVVSETIDERGEWTFVVVEPLPSGAIELSLRMTLENGQSILSEQVVAVSIPETRDATPLVVLGRPGEASQVLQGPFRGVEMDSLMLATIDYDETGAVVFAGRGETGMTVRIFANGASVGEARVGRGGRWTILADALLPPGVYELQVDQVDADGRVVAVIVLPFERVAADALDLGPDRVVVQPGNSLWRLARRLYGEGVQYTVIYEANRDQIRDPNLIYPGQVFSAPREEGQP